MTKRALWLPILLATFSAACGPIEDAIMRDVLWKKLVDSNGEPLYREWKLFPGTDSLTRLGLPVHGRWTTTYVDPVHALPFLESALRTPPHQPLELPPGSIIVKENYRSYFPDSIPPDSLSFYKQKFDSLNFDSLAAEFEVLTVMYKPTPEDELTVGSRYPYLCATPQLEPYNGDPETGCLGGRWFFAFYKIFEPTTGLVQRDTSQFASWVDANVNRNVGSFCVHCHASAFNTDYLRILDDTLNLHTVTPQGNPTRDRVSPPRCTVGARPDPPADVPDDPLKVWNFDPDSAKSMFDCFSWQTFIALSWPADSMQPGQPDSMKSIQDIGSGPTVWQTYSPVYNIFQAGNTGWVVPPFGSTPQITGCDNPEGRMILTLNSKARDIANETGQAFAGTFGKLVDRNRHEVWYEVFANEVEYDYIVENGLASTPRLTPGGPTNFTVSFPFDSAHHENSIEVKSAWKQLCTGQECRPVDDPDDYYTTEVLHYHSDTGGCTGPHQSGLIGLHLAIKTFWAPQWVWATFSHELNAPTVGTSDMQADSFSFFDPGLPPDTFPELTCGAAPFLISPAGCPNVVLNRFPDGPGTHTRPSWLPPVDHPNQITRLAPPSPELTALNSEFQAALDGTPFKNYVLLDTQWPLNGQVGTREVPKPNMHACADTTLGTNCFQSIPRYLRNPVIESYMTTYAKNGTQVVQSSNRGCLSCHLGGANGSYFWLDAVGIRVPVSQ